MEFWKTLTAPLIVAIVGGIIVGVILTKTSGPETPEITAQMRWLDVTNPLAAANKQVEADVEKAIQSITGISGAGGDMVRVYRFSHKVRLAIIDFQNNSNVRSKEIEFARKGDGFFVSAQISNSADQMKKTIKLRPIDPGQSAQVFVLSDGSYGFVNPEVLALHDGKKLSISSRMVPDEIAAVLA